MNQAVSTELEDNSDIGARLLVIENKKFCIGLEWELPDQSDMDSKKDLIKAARNFDETRADKSRTFYYVALRAHDEGSHWQFGLAEKVPKIRRSVAAAGALADVIKGSWIGMFRLPNGGYWFIQVNEDIVISDDYFSREDEALDIFNEARVGQWDHVYVPEDWKNNHEAYETIDYAEILVDCKDPRLVKLNQLGLEFGDREKKALIFGIIGVAIVGYGYHWYSQRAARNKMIQDAKQKQLEDELKRKQQMVHVNAPWFSLQPVASQLDQCYDNFLKTEPFVPGYSENMALCSFDAKTGAGNFNVNFSRQGLTPQWVDTWVKKEHPELSVNFVRGGAEISVSKPMDKVAARGREPLYKPSDIMSSFQNISDLTGDHYTLQNNKPEIPMRVNVKNVNPPVLPWGKMGFEVSTTSYNLWKDFFESIPGVALTNVSYSYTNNIWKIQGMIYAAN